MRQRHSTNPTNGDFSNMSFGAKSREFREGASRRGKLTFEGIRYASKAELYCAKSLQAFCDWQPVEGTSYQVPIGHRKSVDFVIDGVFLEFHPIILSRSMYRPAYKLLKNTLQRIKPDQRYLIREALKEHLLEEYTNKRDWTMRQHSDPRICEAELLVVASSASFYDDVLKRFAVKRLPARKTYLAHFKAASFPKKWNE